VTRPIPYAFRLLDEPSFTHVGKMDFVDNRVDPATGTIRGRRLVPNPNGFLTPGQYGRLQLIGSGEFDALLVPDSAILSDQSQRFVWALGKDDSPGAASCGAGQYRAWLAHRACRAAARRSNRD
jgi:multidrug efflux pump subunit AcrA (membrane-fusion protein)